MYVFEFCTTPSAFMNTRLYSFLGGTTGSWQVESLQTLIGKPLALFEKLAIADGLSVKAHAIVSWRLNEITSNERYAPATKNRLWWASGKS
jgi:hypothetical protein